MASKVDWSATPFTPPEGQTWVLRLSPTLYEVAGPIVSQTTIVPLVSLTDGTVTRAGLAELETGLKESCAYKLPTAPKLRALKLADLQALAEQQDIAIKINNKNKTKDTLIADLTALSKNWRDSTN